MIYNERELRSARENHNERLKNILIEKENKLKQICNDKENILRMHNDCNHKNNYIKSENDKLRNQIKILENQNLIIINEIDNILDENKNKNIMYRNKFCSSNFNDNNINFKYCPNDFNIREKYSYNKCDKYNYIPSSSRFTYEMGNRIYN